MSELVFRAITEDGDTFQVNKTLPVWPMQYDEMEMWTWIFSYLGIRPFRGLGDSDKYQLRNSYLGLNHAQAVDAMLVTNPEDFMTAAHQALQHIPGAEHWANPEATLLIARDTFFFVVVPLFTDPKTVAVVEQSVDHRTIGSSLTHFDRPNSVVLELMERATKEGAAFQTTKGEELFDVSKYDVDAYNEDTEDEIFFLFDRDDRIEPLYLVRRMGCRPIYEVTYSRLCDRIGLPNVRTVYGTILPAPLPGFRPLAYVAVSSFSRHWVTFQDWKEAGGTVTTLANSEDYYGHRLLSLLAHQSHIGADDFGYVLDGGRYLKAGNWDAFSDLRIKQCFYGSYAMPWSLMNVEKIMAEMSEMDLLMSIAKPAAEGLASLTDADIAAIIAMPRGPQTLWVREALRTELSRMRALAKGLLQAGG